MAYDSIALYRTVGVVRYFYISCMLRLESAIRLFPVFLASLNAVTNADEYMF